MSNDDYCPAFQTNPTPCLLPYDQCQDQHVHHAREEDVRVDLLSAISAAEDALAQLSNALGDVAQEQPRGAYQGNIDWADAAVDRALRDLATMREWIENAATA